MSTELLKFAMLSSAKSEAIEKTLINDENKDVYKQHLKTAIMGYLNALESSQDSEGLQDVKSYLKSVLPSL